MSTAEDFKNRGNEAFKAKRYEEAISWYSKGIEVDPNSEAASALYSNRAASYTSLGRHEECLRDAEDCIRVRPAWLKGHFRKGLALEALGRIDEAVKAFEEALRTDTGNEECQTKLQDIRARIKDRNERMKPAQCRTAEDAKVIGNSLFGLGKYEQAMLFYSRAIELTPVESEEKANYYSNRAACYQQTHQYQQVIADANAALAINPRHVKALIRRAIAFEGLEKWQLALTDYNEVNSVSPGMQNVSQGILRCQRAIRN